MTFEPDEPVLFMKVGTHAGEDLAAIIRRKRAEVEEAGFSLWGYGGNTCHPTTMVQPFAHASTTGTIRLCMMPMISHHFAEQIRASEYSVDGQAWNPIPAEVNVLGSRYALWIDSLEEVDETLDLSATRVAVGRQRGRAGSEYVQGHVDKACLIVGAAEGAPRPVKIGLSARVLSPYAVFLR